MIITKTQNDSTLNVSIEGRLDSNTAPQLVEEMDGALEGVTELILEVGKLDYISSAGLRVILSLQKIMNNQGEMRLIHVADNVWEVLDITGFSSVLTIE